MFYELALLFCQIQPTEAQQEPTPLDLPSLIPGRDGSGREGSGRRLWLGNGSLGEEGDLVVHLGSTEFLLTSDLLEPKVEPWQDARDFLHRLNFCGPPLHGDVDPRAIVQWIQYHRFHVGYNHVFLYDAGSLGSAVRRELLPFLEGGVLTIVDFTEERFYPSWYFSQAVAMHDCLFRNFFSTPWLAFGDLDEYLITRFGPLLKLKSFLRIYASRRPWVSYGCYLYAHFCSGRKLLWEGKLDTFAVELMKMRQKEPLCERSKKNPHAETCLGVAGRRKFIVSPRMVEILAIHRVQELAFWARFWRPLHLPANEVSFGHFRGMTNSKALCLNNKPGIFQFGYKTEEPSHLLESNDIAGIAEKARLCTLLHVVPSFECKLKASVW